jgi:hypothetical protein
MIGGPVWNIAKALHRNLIGVELQYLTGPYGTPTSVKQ